MQSYLWNRKPRKDPSVLITLPEFPNENVVTIQEHPEGFIEYVEAAEIEQAKRNVILPENLTEEQKKFYRSVHDPKHVSNSSEDVRHSQYQETEVIAESDSPADADDWKHRLPGTQQLQSMYKTFSSKVSDLRSKLHLSYWIPPQNVEKAPSLSNSAAGCTIRFLKSHPTHHSMAVAYGDTVVIYSVDHVFPVEGGLYPHCLVHEMHQDLSYLDWSPFENDTLAVCSKLGIIIWKLGSQPAAVRVIPIHQGAKSVCWISPDILLIHQHSGKLRVWDAFGEDSELPFNDVSVLEPGPDNNVALFTTFRATIGMISLDSYEVLMECHTGKIISLAWLPDGSGFLFTKTDSMELMLCNLWKKHGDLYQPTLSFSVCAEFSSPNPTEITDIKLDPTGSKLAVMIRHLEASNDSQRLLLCAMKHEENLRIDCVVGWITLGKGEFPLFVEFSEVFSSSSRGVLTVAAMKEESANTDSAECGAEVPACSPTTYSCRIVHIPVCCQIEAGRRLKIPKLDATWARAVAAQNRGLFSSLLRFVDLVRSSIPVELGDDYGTSSTLEADLSVYAPSQGTCLIRSPDVSSFGFGNPNGSTISTIPAVGLSSFIDRQVVSPQSERSLRLRLPSESRSTEGRSIKSEDRFSPAVWEPKSDHHMSVDSTPDVWKARPRFQSPPNSGTGGKMSVDRSLSESGGKPPKGLSDSLVEDMLSIGKLTFTD